MHEGVHLYESGRVSRTVSLTVVTCHGATVELLRLGGIRASVVHVGPSGKDPSEFRHTDPVKCGELVASRGLDAEEGTRPSLHKLVGN